MVALTLDTYEIVKELRAAGFNDPQAEAVTNSIKRLRDTELAGLATKLDVSDVRRGVEALRFEFYRMLLTVAGLQTIVIIGAVAGIIRVVQT